MRVRNIRPLILVAAVTTLALATPGSSHAHFTWPQYSYKTSGDCQGPVDPVSLYYYGAAAVNHRVTRDIIKHTGWKHDGHGHQYIRDHGVCSRNWSSPASGGATSSRYHVRIWGMNSKDSAGRWETVGTPHHEDFVKSCGLFGGHAVDKGAVDRKNYRTRQGSGFDQGRRKIRQKVNTRSHDIKITHLGNTRSFKQCDGDYAGSNGNVLWVSFGRH